MPNADVFLLIKQNILVLITFIFTFVSAGLLAKDLRKNRSKPYLWAWAIRVLICIIALISQFAQGATYSLTLSLAQTLVGFGVIGMILFSKKASFSAPDKTDVTTLFFAALGLVIWVASGDALFAILGVLVADACATAIGVRAAIRGKASESYKFWSCALVAASAALISTKGSHWSLALVPAFSCLNAIVNIAVSMYANKLKAKPELVQKVV